MECENIFCVYYDEKDKCVLDEDEITIDVLGRCQTCICIEVDEEILRLQRKVKRDQFEEVYKQWIKRK